MFSVFGVDNYPGRECVREREGLGHNDTPLLLFFFFFLSSFFPFFLFPFFLGLRFHSAPNLRIALTDNLSLPPLRTEYFHYGLLSG
jgi:hypothetical protein